MKGFRIWDKLNERYIQESEIEFEGSTNIKDKNGNLIYFGDVVKVDDDAPDTMLCGRIIDVGDGHYPFNENDRCAGFCINGEDCVVIGNIHEKGRFERAHTVRYCLVDKKEKK